MFRFGGKYNVGVPAIDILCEFVGVIFINEYERVVNVSEPIQRRMWSGDKCPGLKYFHVQVCYDGGYQKCHCCTMSLFIILTFIKKSGRR